MLIGRYEVNMDSKNRIKIPSVLVKKILGKELVIILYNGYLCVIPKIDVVSFIAFMESKMSPKEVVMYEREVFQKMREVRLDEYDRILIPSSFAEEIDLKDEIILIGIRNRIEIWNPQTLEYFHLRDKKVLTDLLGESFDDFPMKLERK